MTGGWDPSDPDAFRRALDRAGTLGKGSYFEAFAAGRTIEHRPGLELTRHGSELWASQTLNHQPRYWRRTAARERGREEPPVHPDYLLACVMGPSVEALSEKGGYLLGRDDVRIHALPPAGTEVRVESEVLATRPSGSRPEYGIVIWETRGYDAGTDEPLVSYERTNMVPREEPVATDGAGDDSPPVDATRSDLPAELIAPDGPYFEDFEEALDRADGRDAAVAYRHERGRTMDDVLVSTLPLLTLNTARQHHDRVAMADAPSGAIVAYGDVTRSIALGHARSDERTRRELGYDDERFHDFVTAGDTIYGFTRVLDADPAPDPGGLGGCSGDRDDVSGDRGGGSGDCGDDADDRGGGSDARGDVPTDRVGRVEFEHVAFDQDRTPVYSGKRTALVERRPRDDHLP